MNAELKILFVTVKRICKALKNHPAVEHITECCMVGSWLRCLILGETLCWEAAPFGSPGGSLVLQIPCAGAAGSLGSLPAACW